MTFTDTPLPLFDHPAEEPPAPTPPRPWHGVPPPSDADAPEEEVAS